MVLSMPESMDHGTVIAVSSGPLNGWYIAELVLVNENGLLSGQRMWNIVELRTVDNRGRGGVAW
jgi:hypothetical protein